MSIITKIINKKLPPPIEIFKALKKRVWSSNEVLLLNCPKGKYQVKEIECEGEIKEITDDNIRDCLAFDDINHLNTYYEFLKRGDDGQYGYLDGVCVFRRWTMMGGENKYIDFCKRNIIPLSKNSVLFHYSYTSESARGKGLHSKALQLHTEKYREFDRYATVVPTNYSSLVGFYRCGFEVMEHISVKYRLFFSKMKIRTDIPNLESIIIVKNI